MSEVALYVGDRVALSRAFAEMVLTMLPLGYEEVLEVTGTYTQPDGVKQLQLKSISRQVVPPATPDPQAP